MLADRSGVPIKMTSGQLQNSLADVANIPTRVITNQAEIDAAIEARRTWKPLGWMQPGPPNVPRPSYRDRGDDELEELAVAMLKKKISGLGMKLDLTDYVPEDLGGDAIETLTSLKEVTPFSLAVATRPKRNGTLYFSEAEVKAKVASIISLFKAEAADRRGEAKVATESSTGQIELTTRK